MGVPKWRERKCGGRKCGDTDRAGPTRAFPALNELVLFGSRLTRFEAAFNRDAWSYLLVLRLLPIFPFFLVNLGAALIGVRFSVFALTTYIGIVPGALVYASIGNGISVLLRRGAQPELSLIGRPEIFGPLVGFAILALAPVVWRRLQKSGAY